MDSTVTQIKIDELLVRKPRLRRYNSGDRIPVELDGYGLFQHLDARVSASLHFGKVIVISHWSPPVACFFKFVCLPRRDDPNQGVALALAVTEHEYSAGFVDAFQSVITWVGRLARISPKPLQP